MHLIVQVMKLRSKKPAATSLMLSWALSFALVVGLSSTVTSARPLDEVMSSGVLNVIVYRDNKPYSWETDGGDVIGIDAEIARAIAGIIKVKANVIARSAGEEVDDDLRSNIWQGPRTGGIKGDVMMHVPLDPELIARNNLVALSNPYYYEETVVAVDPAKAGGKGLDAFKSMKVAVKFSNAAHYFLAFANDGAYRENVSPWMNFDDAATYFVNGEAAGLAGPRSEVEAALSGRGVKVEYIVPDIPDTLRSKWNVGTAVNHDSRDLGYAIGKALRALAEQGEIAKIFEKHGASYVPPPVQ